MNREAVLCGVDHSQQPPTHLFGHPLHVLLQEDVREEASVAHCSQLSVGRKIARHAAETSPARKHLRLNHASERIKIDLGGTADPQCLKGHMRGGPSS